VDATKDIVTAVNHTLRELALKEKKADTIIGFIGWGVDRLLEEALGSRHKAEKEAAIDIFLRFQKEHLMDNTFLYPDVRETISHLKNKKMAVISNRNESSCRMILEAFGLAGYFQKIMGGDEVICRKPSSCPIDTARGYFGVPKKRSMMVGDMEIDVIAGREAGVVTCAVTYGLGKKADLKKAGPDFMIDDIAQLKDIVK